MKWRSASAQKCRLLQAMRPKKKLVIGLLLIGGGWALYHFLSGGNEIKPTNNAVRVSAAPVVKKDVAQTLELVGNVVAYESVAVKSRVDSQINNVLFKDGDFVMEGQQLFELDDRAITAQMRELEASLAKDQAQLVNAKLQFERAVKLAKSNTVSQSRVDETRAAYQAQLAQVKATKANLENTNVLLSYSKIIAPISGRAGTINVTRGNNVRASDTQPLVTINQVKPIRVKFSIAQRYYDKVREKMNAGTLQVTANRSESKETSLGALEYLDNAIDSSSGTFAARAMFANDDETLWPGMFVSVQLALGTLKDTLTVPSIAIQGDEHKHYVYAIDRQKNIAAQKPVELVQIGDGVAAIASGISENDWVATDGLLRLTDGATVDIVASDAGGAELQKP